MQNFQELFGAIGAVKSVKLVKPGTAEVMYVKKEIASLAIKTYHDRELDGNTTTSYLHYFNEILLITELTLKMGVKLIMCELRWTFTFKG